MRSFVYVIGTEQGPCKVGVSSNPEGRLATIQTGSAVKLDLFYYREARSRAHALLRENWFHEAYSEDRLEGEWFALTADLAAEGVDTGFDLELYYEQIEREMYQAAALNIWCEPDGAHA